MTYQNDPKAPILVYQQHSIVIKSYQKEYSMAYQNDPKAPILVYHQHSIVVHFLSRTVLNGVPKKH